MILEQRGDEETGHNADEYDLDQSADHITDKSTKGRLESAFDFPLGQQLEEKGPQEWAQDNSPEAEEDYAHYQADKSAQDAVFAGLEFSGAQHRRQGIEDEY